MRLTYLRATNWMAYPDIDLDFTADEYVITGLNNHGKSALLDAITWALWGRIGKPVDQRSVDRLIRAGSDGQMSVGVGFDASDGTAVAVRREKATGKTATLSLWVDGDRRTHHTMAETQDAIDGLVGLDYESITAGPFMVQRQSDSFMAADPRRRKDLLIRLLGLERYEVLHKEANARRVAAERDEEEADRRLAETGAVDVGEAERAAKVAESLLEAARHRVDVGTGDVLACREALAASRAKADGARVTRERLAKADAVWRDRKQQMQNLLARQNAYGERGEESAPPAPARSILTLDPQAIELAEQAVAEAQAADQEVATLAAKRARWADRCDEADRQRAILPTVPCRGEGEYAACRFLTDIPSAADVAKAREAITRWDAQIAPLLAVVVQRPERDAELRRLRGIGQALAQEEAEQARYEGRVAAWRERVTAARDAVSDLDVQIRALKKQIAEAEADIASLREEASETGDDVASLEAEVAEAERKLAADRAVLASAERDHIAAAGALAVARKTAEGAEEWRAKAKDARERAEVLRLLEAAWHRDGIPTTIIEQAVPAIEARTNEVLARFPQSMTVVLRTQKPVNKGAGMAETLDIIVTIHGWEREYGLLSVGARLRIDIALRVALGEVLAHRTGRRVRTLWLDEPLADLDPEGREAVIETLHALRDDFDLIVAISHHSDFNDRFGARLDVQQDERGDSTVEVAA